MLRQRYGVTSYEERLRESQRPAPPAEVDDELTRALEHERKWRGQPEHVIRAEMERAVFRRLEKGRRGRGVERPDRRPGD